MLKNKKQKKCIKKDKTEQRKISFEVKMAYIIKCWNYYRIGTQAKILKYDDKVESFPIAK